ncbi:MAG: thiamine-phosphate kinase [Cytophagales bacterium]|mgnify:FL=1
MDTPKRTEIGAIGEFGLIDKINQRVVLQHASTLKGIGDDAAVLDGGSDHKKLISTDMLLEGVHFDLSYIPLTHLGYKAVTVNVSDIAAMNGIPKQMTISLGLSNRMSVEAVEALYEGIHAAAKDYQIDIVGGDTTSSRSGLVISITLIGESAPDNIVYRNGAKEGDILCLSGDIGGAYMGLQILEREKEVFKVDPNMQPQLDKYSYIVGRQLRPKARMDVIHELRDLGILPTSMIDISDGLASEIFHLCKQSQKGACIYEDKLPIEKQTFETAAEFSMDPNTAALNGGEDYELLFTIDQKDFEKMKNHDDITTIGYMHAPDLGKVMVTNNKNTIELTAQGWIHF